MVRPPDHRPSTCEKLELRGLSINLRRWGPREGRPLVLLHGTQDSSITFQFLVDQLAESWSIVSPDWRGHGHSQWFGDCYWFHDFIGDLDALMEKLFPDSAVPIIGHSLGGNVAGIYAGLQPERVTHLISLDGFGPLTSKLPVDVPTMLRSMMIKTRTRRSHRSYAGLPEIARRLIRANPRLTETQALFLAEHSTKKLEDGRRAWLFDPCHQYSMPSLHRLEHWLEIWSRVKIPVLWVSSTDWRKDAPSKNAECFARRMAAISDLTHIQMEKTGHNLHHDAPERIAAVIQNFICSR